MKSAEWRSSCDDAITRTSDAKVLASLLFGRAYAAVEDYRYEDALKDLDAALNALPDNAKYLRERAYVQAELSNFEQAIADLDHAVRLNPKDILNYRERAFARHYSGDLQGAYDDRAREFELTPDSADALMARGIAAVWLGRFDDAMADLNRARSLAKSANDDDVQSSADEWLSNLDHWRNTTRGGDAVKLCQMERLEDRKNAPKLIGDCSKVYLDAKAGDQKADALTTRSAAWLLATGSQNNSTEDMRIALALDPKNSQRHINLGYSYLSSNHSWAANREFERAVAMERSPMALAGRAAARKNLGDKDGAFADARDSIELEPTEPAAWVLADLEFDNGNLDGARQLYLLLYERGSRSDLLMERLRDLGVPDPAAAVKK
jgi:tetratricopeptide (TPR) repeat protein